MNKVSPRAAAGAQPFGPFLLDRRIAVGGNAEVYLARPKMGHTPAEQLVIKRLLPKSRESGDFDALEREAELHRSVAHPNVVKVFGAGMVGDEPYLAMEYVDGIDLYGLMRRSELEHRRIPPDVAVYIAEQVALALDSVHHARDERGRLLQLVHRDVTPSNIYLSVDGDIKLGDFGIARAMLPGRHEATLGLKGKFGYLAPEQVAGEPFDHRADLFALTAILGELLIGRRIFPGSGQLAVLLSIRDVNIQPLRDAARSLPKGLFALCERGLSRDPEKRFQDAKAFASELVRFVPVRREDVRSTLNGLVTWARDPAGVPEELRARIRDSVERVHRRENGKSSAPSTSAPSNGVAKFRRSGTHEVEDVNYPNLIELIATGSIGGDDEVAFGNSDFSTVRSIPELARHLLQSTTAPTGRLFEPGAPDHSALLEDTPMMALLARLRQKRETGTLFVSRNDHADRKEIYLQKGRLLHVASSDREELLGEYLVGRGRITRKELDRALTRLAEYGGRLGDTLVSMGLVQAVDVFRAIRDQGRDRVAALCGWQEGIASFYRRTEPGAVVFPLDLDLASPMMMGAIVASKGKPQALLPPFEHLVCPGRRAEAALRPRERGSAPSSLQRIIPLSRSDLSIQQIVDELTGRASQSASRMVTEKEACAALAVARALRWIEFREPH